MKLNRATVHSIVQALITGTALAFCFSLYQENTKLREQCAQPAVKVYY